MSQDPILAYNAKIVDAETLRGRVAQHKADGQEVVWTNGCFDILHAGHAAYLIRARQEGDVLVVGMNSDASVREVKGPGRPVNNERDRAFVLASLASVDYVVIFADKTPMPLLEMLEPGVYAKGDDYTIGTVAQEERRFVESYGGRIAIVRGVPGHSTTRTIGRITGGA